jgi:penicillin G amidase
MLKTQRGSRAVRIIRRIMLVAALLLAAISGAVYVWLRSSLPVTQGRISLKTAGLSAPVDILRDRHGVPHIYARSEADGLAALGYAHAQDRLWQMEVNRRIGAGRLSEIFGSATLETDRFIRTVGIRQAAQKALDSQPPEMRQLLEAYARGVNAFLDSRRGALPPEFLLLGVTPERWTALDSMSWTKVMALDMAYSFRRELERLQLLHHLPPERINQLLPPYPGAQYPALPDLAKLYGDLPAKLALPDSLKAPPGAPGSNNWVVAGSRTVTGKPLLANDPHINMSSPAVWYLAHLNIDGANRVGVTFPGLPALVLGRTDHIAWGFTNTAPDVHDLIIERITNRFAGLYRTPDGIGRLTGRREVIKVKGAADVPLLVRESANGPLISDAFPDLKAALGGFHALALRWVALKETDSTVVAGLSLPRARTVSEAVAVLRQFEAPQNNVLIADVAGHIGYVAAGTVPKRHPHHPGGGIWPVPGSLPESRWQGWLSYDSMPRRVDPPEGWLATANQDVSRPEGPVLGHDWEDPWRYNRIAQLLQAKEKHDVASFAAMQGDAFDPAMAQIIPALLKLAGTAAPASDVQAVLSRWDHVMAPDRAEPLIAAAWVRTFEHLLIADDLSEDFASFDKHRPRFLALILKDADAGAYWCDNQKTQATESCAAMAASALESALEDLRAAYGNDWRRWRWDHAHVVVHKHRPFSEAPGWTGAKLRQLFELRSPMGGSGNSLLNAHAGYKGDNGFEATLSQSYRGIFDLANLDNSRFAIPTGQSGHPFSPHYRDMELLWRNMHYIRIPTQRSALGKAHTLTLLPAATNGDGP